VDLSIVIVNLNDKDRLKACLESIHEKVQALDYEVFVVDNASTDGSAEMVKQSFPWVKLIQNDRNLGFARANNQAIRISQGRYVLLLNCDTRLLDRTSSEMIRYMDDTPRFGALAPKVMYRDGTIQTSNNAFPDLFTEFLRLSRVSSLISDVEFRRALGVRLGRFLGQSINEYLRVYWDHDRLREIDWATAACLLVRRKTIDQIGLLDEGFFMYYEDADWCLRMHRRGWKRVYFPHFSIVHDVGRGRGDRHQLEDISRHRSRFYYYNKHAAFLKRAILRAMVMAAIFPRWLFLGRKRAVYADILRLCLSYPLRRVVADGQGAQRQG
jgi:GT2 family glycosyltransferase